MDDIQIAYDVSKKRNKNPSDIIKRAIEYVRKAYGCEIEYKLVKLFAENDDLTISFAAMLNQEQLESFPYFVHCFYAVDSRTQRIDSQYIVKEKIEKKGVDFTSSTKQEINDEEQQIQLHRDTKLYSSKTNSSGLKLEITTNFYGFIIHHSLPTQGSTHDLHLYRMNSKKVSLQGKYILGDSGYVGDDPQLLTRIKKSEFTKSEKCDKDLMDKKNYFNDLQSKLRIIVENTFARMVKVFKWFKTIPTSRMENIRSIMSMGIGIVNFHISLHKLRSRRKIRKESITEEELIVMQMRDELFDLIESSKGDTTNIKDYDMKFKQFIEMSKNVKESELIDQEEIMKQVNENNEINGEDSFMDEESMFQDSKYQSQITKDMLVSSLMILKYNRWLESDCFTIWFHILNSSYNDSSYVVMDSFFFEKMSQDDKFTQQYQNTKINLIGNKKKLLLLKSIGSHYILYMVTFGETYVNSVNENTILANIPCICIFDSLNQTRSVLQKDKIIIENFTKLIRSNISGKLNIPTQNFHEIVINVHSQDNYIDCGVHCCFYIEQLLSLNPSSISQIEGAVKKTSVFSYRKEMFVRMEMFGKKQFDDM